MSGLPSAHLAFHNLFAVQPIRDEAIESIVHSAYNSDLNNINVIARVSVLIKQIPMETDGRFSIGISV